jgi:hypothetical protein
MSTRLTAVLARAKAAFRELADTAHVILRDNPPAVLALAELALVDEPRAAADTQEKRSPSDTLHERMPISLETLAFNLSEDIWCGMDGALGNLDTAAGQTEAWAVLIDSISRSHPGEVEVVGQFRDALVAGIRARVEQRTGSSLRNR